MNIRTHSTMALAWLTLATMSAPALADGMPGSRGAKQSAAQPVVTASRKSNDSGVTLQYQFSSNPKVGKPTAITLQFDGVTNPDGATVRLSSDAGLTLSGSNALTLPPGASTTTVTVVSDREGLAYLNVFIAQGTARSAISIPVQTGSDVPAMKPTGEVNAMPGGEKIISLPAK